MPVATAGTLEGVAVPTPAKTIANASVAMHVARILPKISLG
jgi:hypothetical protein